MKTIDLAEERITVEFTEFELTALAALVERGQIGVTPERDDSEGIRHAITGVATEFRSLLGHFELMAEKENPSNGPEPVYPAIGAHPP